MASQCCVCRGDIDPARALRCHDGHLVCAEDCLGGVALMALAPQQIRRLRGAIPCPWRGEVVRGIPEVCPSPCWTLEDVAPLLSPVNAARCAAAMRDMVSTLLAVEAGLLANRDAGQPAARAEEAVPGPAAIGARVAAHRRSIVEHILTLRCPRCRAAFADFVGCDALACEACGGAFCAICLKDCGTDAHGHLRGVRFHGARDYFGGEERYNRHHRARRARLVADAIAGLDEPPAVKLAVLEALEADLTDLGIARAADVEPLLPPERMRAGPQPAAPLPRGVGGERGIAEGGVPARDAYGAAAAAAAAAAPQAPAAQQQYHDGMMLFIQHVVPWLLPLAGPALLLLAAMRLRVPRSVFLLLLALLLPMLPLMLLLGPVVRPMLRPIAWLPVAAGRLGLRALVAGLQMRARARAAARAAARGPLVRCRKACIIAARALWWTSVGVVASAAVYAFSPCPAPWAVLGGAWDLLWTAGPVALHLVSAISAICSSVVTAVYAIIDAPLTLVGQVVLSLGAAMLEVASVAGPPTAVIFQSTAEAIYGLRLARLGFFCGPPGYAVLGAAAIVVLPNPRAQAALLRALSVSVRTGVLVLWLASFVLRFSITMLGRTMRGVAHLCAWRAALADARALNADLADAGRLIAEEARAAAMGGAL